MEAVADRFADQLSDVGFVPELDFPLGRMDVDVDEAGGELQKEAADRVAAFHQTGMVAFGERPVQAGVVDRPAVDEKILIGAGRSRYAGRTDQAPQPHRSGSVRLRIGGAVRFQGGFGLQREHFAGFAVERAPAPGQAFGSPLRTSVGFQRRQMPDIPVVVKIAEGDLRIGERDRKQVLLDMGPFGFHRA